MTLNTHTSEQTDCVMCKRLINKIIVSDLVLNRRKIALVNVGLFLIPMVISRSTILTNGDTLKCSTLSDVDTELSATASRKQWTNGHSH
ncbi:hypothetical protein CDAR_611601 [Caerostris darwini]|uniref:Uncharacterized protein n=1 Tax=Caerostris darwini TaxID=1538125 RepID=A0AAV4U2U8_9ARAC|nr:hypothetical protein CDAR_611601 [Caerostris darwini]